MTLVNLSVKETILGGFASASASCEAVYWAGNGPYHEVVGSDVRYSTSIKVMFSGESISLELEPTRGICCVRWTIRNQRTGDTLTRFTTIPDDTEVNFGDLVRVDPESFEPSDFGVPGWESAVVEATTAVSEAVMARDESREAAQTSNLIKVTVENSVNVAAGHALSAATSASRASSYKIDAELALSRALSTAESMPTLVGEEIATRITPLITSAEESSRTSAESAAEAESHKIFAQNSEETVHADAVAAAQARLEASGFATSANQSSISAEAARLASVEARTGAETARTEAEAARDLALAGQFAGTPVVASPAPNLDQFLTPGVYKFTAAVALAAINKPPTLPADPAFILTVTSLGPSNTVSQRIEIVRPTVVMGVWIRHSGATSFLPWKFMPTQRVDTTAGVAVYTWDEVNRRELLTYGDTGKRRVEHLFENGWIASLATVRRIGNVVEFAAYGLRGQEATGNGIFVLPTGFRDNATNAADLVVLREPLISVNYTTGRISSNARGGSYAFRISLLTVDPWPTILPGSLG